MGRPPPVWIGFCTTCLQYNLRDVVPKRIAMRVGPHCSWCEGHCRPYPDQNAAIAAYMLGGYEALGVLPI